MLVLLVTLAAAGTSGVATLVLMQHRRAIAGQGENALSLGREVLHDAGRRVSLLSSEVKAELARRGLGTLEPQPEPPGLPPDRAPAAKKKVATLSKPDADAQRADADATAPVPPKLRAASASNGWRGARWGMSVDEVLRTFPGKAARLGVRERERIDGLVSAAAIRRVRIGTHPYVVSFLFDRTGSLAAVQLRLAGPAGDAALAYDEAAGWLSAEHGPAPEHTEESSPSGSWLRRARWTAPGALIELRGGETVLQESRVISVNIRAGLMRPLPEGGVLLTYRPVASPNPRF